MTEYMKFEPGEKFGKRGADISPTLEGLNDAGYVLEDRELCSIRHRTRSARDNEAGFFNTIL